MAVKKDDFKPKKKGIDLSASAAAVAHSKSALESATQNSFATMFGIDPAQPASSPGFRELPVADLEPYSNTELGYLQQPFKMYNESRLRELADDIEEQGILNPLIVRPSGDKFQILSGHNRAAAAKLLQLDTVPVIVKEIDDVQAAMIVVNSNLLQREKLLPSEKAFAYKLRLDSMKQTVEQQIKQGASQIGTHQKLRSNELVAKEVGESKNQIARYIRLTELIPELLDLVDEEQIPMNAGVSLSYLDKDFQAEVLDLMGETDKTMTLLLADKIKALDPITSDALRELFYPPEKERSPSKPKEEKQREVKIPYSAISDYIKDPAMPDSEIVEIIKESLRLYNTMTLVPPHSPGD